MISINFDQFYAEIKDVLKHPRPFAHIRFGDGEGIVMGYPEYTKGGRASQRWHKWIGKNNIDMEMFAKLIRESVKAADIVGTPCKRHQTVNQDWRNVKVFMDRYKLLANDKKVCCMDCTVDLQKMDLYKELLSHRKELYYISCRKVDEELENKFNIEYVRGFHLPPQNRPFRGEVLTNKTHYPYMYNFIKTWVEMHDIRGKVFLVGAGGFGKIYCTWIKNRGGIALDIGSIFDGWKGFVTRSYLKNIKEYTI